MWLLASRIGAAIGGALSGAVALTVLYTFFYSAEPTTLEEANEQLDRIANAIETLVPKASAAEAEAVETLQERAIQVAQASFGTTDIPEAQIFKNSEGIFQISVGEVFDIKFPNGEVRTLVLGAGGSQYNAARLVIGGKDHSLDIGKSVKVVSGRTECSILFVALVKGTNRFQWRCASQ